MKKHNYSERADRLLAYCEPSEASFAVCANGGGPGNQTNSSDWSVRAVELRRVRSIEGVGAVRVSTASAQSEPTFAYALGAVHVLEGGSLGSRCILRQRQDIGESVWRRSPPDGERVAPRSSDEGAVLTVTVAPPSKPAPVLRAIVATGARRAIEGLRILWIASRAHAHHVVRR